MSYVPIFHLTIPAIWVSVLIAAALTNFLLRFALKEKPGDWLWNAVSLYILIWKLSYILFNFENFLEMPLSILYFNGGLYGHLLGIVLVIVYLTVTLIKQPKLANQPVFAWLLFFVSYQAVLQIFENNVLEAIFHSLLLIVSILAIRYLVKRADVPTDLLLAALFTLELLIVSVFAPLISWQIATLVTLAVITIFFYNRFAQKGQIV
ncbi:hypothetical protein [Planococcus halocryophilus]|uniref:hypothetical protein n=1 Tax=Planococcus halocryophilus TaxID=1215089 RepID=UPI001F0D446B|nr:hypothetical protein [Planococcus halocryophilus]MCH4827298.1 hypothetical protein [Planococcus halocryophilus]